MKRTRDEENDATMELSLPAPRYGIPSPLRCSLVLERLGGASVANRLAHLSFDDECIGLDNAIAAQLTAKYLRSSPQLGVAAAALLERALASNDDAGALTALLGFVELLPELARHLDKVPLPSLQACVDLVALNLRFDERMVRLPPALMVHLVLRAQNLSGRACAGGGGDAERRKRRSGVEPHWYHAAAGDSATSAAAAAAAVAAGGTCNFCQLLAAYIFARNEGRSGARPLTGDELFTLRTTMERIKTTGKPLPASWSYQILRMSGR